MAHEFEVRLETPVDATPDQVWAAIATGPGIDSWFMGRNEIEPRVGGKGRMTMGEYTQESTVTAWEPGHRLAYRSAENPDGTFMAFEYLIEGRDGGGTVVRLVHNGFLGDDWEAEYDALTKGDAMYLDKLAQYLAHFPGRTSTYNMFIPGPQVADPERVREAFEDLLGVTGKVTEGDKVRLALEGLPPVDGVVDYAIEPFLGVRTATGLYRFMHGYRDTVVVELHDFSDDVDAERTEQAWQAWLTRSFA
jgi:uncharacterized protein YndB with AHSA1/START domain